MPVRFAKRLSTSVILAGVPASARVARQLMHVLLPGCPRLGDCELVATELIANAIRHSVSGDEGGTFLLAILVGEDRVRIEVEDKGSATGPGDWQLNMLLASGPAPGDCHDVADFGRGLYLVQTIADKSGHEATDSNGHVAWAELNWNPRLPGRVALSSRHGRLQPA